MTTPAQALVQQVAHTTGIPAAQVTTILNYPTPNWWLYTYNGIDQMDDMAMDIAIAKFSGLG